MPAEAKVGLRSFNEAIDGLNVKLDSYFARLEGKLEDAITSIKDTVIKRLQENNNSLRQRLREVERKLENNPPISKKEQYYYRWSSRQYPCQPYRESVAATVRVNWCRHGAR